MVEPLNQEAQTAPFTSFPVGPRATNFVRKTSSSEHPNHEYPVISISENPALSNTCVDSSGRVHPVEIIAVLITIAERIDRFIVFSSKG
jgi:hypothetical protein